MPDSIAARLGMLEDAFNRLSDLPQRVETLGERLERAEASLTARIDTVESSLSARIDTVETSLSARIDMVERSLSTRIDTVERSLSARIDAVESSLSARIDGVELAMHRMETSLRAEIEETRRFMRILHEDLVGRIAVLGDRLPH